MSSNGRLKYRSGPLYSTPVADAWGAGRNRATRDPSIPGLPLELAPSANVSTSIDAANYAGGVSPAIPAGLKAEIGRVGPAIRALNRFRSRDMSDRPGVVVVPESSPSEFLAAWAQSANVAIVAGAA